MSDANKTVGLTFVEALGRGDAVLAKTVISEDLVAVARGSGVGAGSRNYAEILAIFDMFSTITKTGLNPTILSVTAEDDRVVVEWDGHCTLTNGAAYDNHYVHVFFVRDGKIRELREYFDTLLTNEVLGPLMGANPGTTAAGPVG
jgi:ketosteroid isomerase-like protein